MMPSPAASRSSPSPSLESTTNFTDAESESVEAHTDSMERDDGIVVSSTHVPTRVPVGDPLLPGPTITANTAVPVIDATALDNRGINANEQREATRIASLEALGKRHERYFFTADFLAFIVEGSVYRVHEYLFVDLSPLWAEKLARPDRTADPIRLADVSRQEMDAFLSTLYPTREQNDACHLYAYWSAVLRLATMWKFDKQRELAIDALEEIASPMGKLILARRYDVEVWLQPAFIALCMRPATLSLSEAKHLPLQDVLHITSAREVLMINAEDAPTVEEVSDYVGQHILGLQSTDAHPLRGAANTSPNAVGSDEHSMEPSPIALTLSENPTVDEKRAFVALFAQKNFKVALRAVTSRNVRAFLELLKDFSAVLSSPTFFTLDLLPELVNRAAFSIPDGIIVVDLLKAIHLSLAVEGDDGTMKRTLTQSTLREVIQDFVAGVYTFVEGLNEACSKHADFALGYAHIALTTRNSLLSDAFGFGKTVTNDDRSSFNHRCHRLQAFFSALVGAELLAEDQLGDLGLA
ncbi:unnamed protein product [Peniophora sp. CBMAI 1063]|nr:unnamed protein product [Peniophora sp. CBMAI 1063]